MSTSLYKSLIWYLLIITLPMQAKEFLISRGYNGPGLGAFFCSVLGLLHHYDRNLIAGVVIDYDKNGLYYDPSKGSNWWQYYFKPISIGDRTAPKRVIIAGETSQFALLAFYKLPAYRCNQLINKYIKVKSPITKKVDNFFYRNLRNTFVIGVHYRGTDKKLEVKRVEYEKVYAALLALIQRKNLINYKIFVATDEQAFINYIKAKFKNVVYTNAHRSLDGRPVHYVTVHGRPQVPNNAYTIGEESVIDMLLLSRSHVLVRTASCLSLCSTFFNPAMEVISLS